MDKFRCGIGRNIIHILPTGYCIALIAVVLMQVGVVKSSDSSEIPGNHTGVHDPAQFVINASDGRPCFLGSINITVTFSYVIHKAGEVKNHDIKVTTDDDSMQIKGQCSHGNSSQSLLSITWNNGSVELNMIFHYQSKELDNKTLGGNWSLNGISLHFDNRTIQPEAVGADTGLVLRDNVTLFTTPMGLSFFCDDLKKVWIGSENQGAAVTFNMVHLQPFLVQDRTFSEAYVCLDERAGEEQTKTSYIIPIVVACCLAAIVSGVIIGYAISRRLRKFKEQSDYKPM